ncbi:MAG TPA: serine hydrolase domain-containing protein [Candidatus Sulfotelmatobacter sp.]|jgi:CubicO group peptidase (beta-lactamase class C family)|nr:serine hydrolase domain-containing protein [Candidatus Sulfotelmatobacter sp.]
MNFEDLQKSWQAQDAGRKITMDADFLMKEVRRDQRRFRRMIFWRDVREVGVAAVLVPFFINIGRHDHAWPAYVIAFACFMVGSYILIDRWRHKRSLPSTHDSLKNCAAASLTDVTHQIWLLKNILWWYLLPFAVPMLIWMVWMFWQMPPPGAENIFSLIFSMVFKTFGVLFSLGFTAAVNGFLYWLNQFAVKKRLEPRRQELEKLLKEIDPEQPIMPMKTKKPLGPLLLVLAFMAMTALASPFTKDKPATKLSDIVPQYGIPAIAVVVTKDGQICDRFAAGVRKWGDSTPVTTNDQFHIGSCTKSMTATLAGILIDEGKLRWDTTIGEVFPELKGKMDKQYETVTLEQLLHHEGGVPSEPPSAAWKRAWKEIGTPREQRYEFIQAVLAQPPAAPPGTRIVYSNQGYAIVGAMIEKITDRDYETLITEKLFKPLYMDTAGFGPPGTKGQVDQPWGHIRKLGMTIPVQVDNPPAIAPAGRVHASMDDLARYAMLHLQTGTNALLKPETLARLHKSVIDPEDPLGNYACGWVHLKRGWAGGDALWHNGSNTMWYMVMWLAPEKNFSVIVGTNIAGDDAEQACDDAAVIMIHKWLAK